jgi:CAAX prenyl protease-like protein
MLLAVMMTTRAFSAPGFDWLYPLRVMATLCVLLYYWSLYRGRGYLAWSGSYAPILVGAVVFVLWMALEPLAPAASDAQLSQAAALASVSPAARISWLLFRTLGSVVVVPLAEEIAFRGYLTRQLIAEDFQTIPVGTFTWFSYFMSSVVFGALHGRWLAGTIAGMLFALALYRHRRLMDAILAHATANGLITAYVLSTQNWSAWS